MDTRASHPWFTDMSLAQTPDEAAVAIIVTLATAPADAQRYGELVQHGRVLPWRTEPGPALRGS